VACTGSVPSGLDNIVPAPLLVVDPDGRARVAAPDLMFPNGVTITSDNKLLYVAESGAGRLTKFDVAEDGSLSNRRLHAEIGSPPDGLAIDANDEVWVAETLGKAILHLGKDGSVVQRVDVQGKPLACALGGDNRDLLMACMLAEIHFEAETTSTTSWIEVFKVGSNAPMTPAGNGRAPVAPN
jgi:sugar lactone lactonase YvrE